MSTTFSGVELDNAPLEIIDGDRGTHYPSQNELHEEGHCLFLSATNVTSEGLKLHSCQFIDEQKDRVLRKGKLKRRDVVMTTRGTLGNVGYYSDDVPFEHVRINSGMVIFRVDAEKIRPLFLYYALRSRSTIEQINSMRTGSAQPQLPIRDIKKIRIPLPDLPVQDAILERVTVYDDLLGNCWRRVSLLEQSARELFKEWFVRLRYPGYEHDRIVDGVPDGWTRMPASEAVAVNPKTDARKGDEISYVPMAALSESGMSADSSQFERRTVHTNVKFRRDDTLFARITPCLENGKTGYVDFLRPEEVACGSTEFIVLRQRKVSAAFVYCLARSEDFRQLAIKSMTGSSGRQRVQEECFDKYQLLVPGQGLRDDFDDFAGQCFKQVRNLREQNEKLLEARDLLLPRLMDGRVSV